MLEAEKGELIRRINNLEHKVSTLESYQYSTSYTWNASPRPYWQSVAELTRWIENIESNNNWTLTITYADGRTETIGN